MGGYHVRGSTIRTRAWIDDNGETYNPAKAAMEFNNLVLTLGAKQKFPFGVDSRAYYGLGIRGEYTLNTDFAGYLEYLEGTENKFVFGVTLAGGLEIPFSRYVGGVIEVSVNPDFTKQIYLPPQDTGYTDSSGNRILLNEQNITNITFEFTVGFRFLREIIYID